MTWILCAVFFASGASALVFETLWFHQAGLALGNSVWASSLVLSGFMAGLALGNALATRFGERLGDPIRAYAVFEVAIAISGVGLVLGLPELGAWLGPWLEGLLDRPWVLNPLRLGVAFALLLVPSTAMGLTLPLLTRALTRRDPRFGAVLGRLYGWNTLGAVAGVVAAEAWLVGALGIRGSAYAAGAANLLAAAVAFALAARSREAWSAADTAPAPLWIGLREGRRWLAAAFLSGFVLLALEVVWFRFLALYVMGFSVSLALMLATVLAGIGLGGFLGGLALRRRAGSHEAASAVALGSGALCIVSYAAFPWWLDGVGPGLVEDPLEILRLGVPLMLPVSLLSGVFFTLAGAALRDTLPSETATAGALTFANTTGAALGSLAGGFVALPLLGMEGSFFAAALLYGGIGALAWATRPLPRRAALVMAAALAGLAALFPFGSMESRHLQATIQRWSPSGKARPVLVREGTVETLIYLERRELGRLHSHRLVTNGYSMSGSDNRNRRYMKLYVNLPVAIHPDPEDALLISFGVGSTAKALTDTAALERIDVVDISREILEASSVVHPDPREHPLHDPRVRVHVEDGRYFLQTTERRFDLITGEPPPPRQAGVVNLYTREYFALMHDRLKEGGLVTYWLPLHSLTETSSLHIVRAFCDAFPDCSLWNGNGWDLMLMGSRGATGPVPAEHFAAQWRDPVVGPELRELGLERPEQLGALFIGGPEYLHRITADVAPLEDDHPKRVMAPGVYPERLPEIWAEWRDTERARERFLRSEVVARHWPESWRQASLPFFDAQDLINRAGYASWTELDLHIEALHRVLRKTRLRTPVLWALNSDADLQRILGPEPDPGQAPPEVRFHLGARLLAERRYDAAAKAFEQAVGDPERGRDAFRLRIYALCLAGRVQEAERIARERYARVQAPETLPPFWTWMQETYGLDPVPGPRLAAGPEGP